MSLSLNPEEKAFIHDYSCNNCGATSIRREKKCDNCGYEPEDGYAITR